MPLNLSLHIFISPATPHKMIVYGISLDQGLHQFGILVLRGINKSLLSNSFAHFLNVARLALGLRYSVPQSAVHKHT